MIAANEREKRGRDWESDEGPFISSTLLFPSPFCSFFASNRAAGGTRKGGARNTLCKVLCSGWQKGTTEKATDPARVDRITEGGGWGEKAKREIQKDLDHKPGVGCPVNAGGEVTGEGEKGLGTKGSTESTRDFSARALLEKKGEGEGGR